MVYKNEQERKANEEKKKLYDPSNILLCLRRRVIPQWRDHPEGRRWGVGEVGGLRGGGERQPVTRFHNGGIGAATPVLVSGQAVGRRDGALVVYVDVRTSSSPFNPAIPPPPSLPVHVLRLHPTHPRGARRVRVRLYHHQLRLSLPAFQALLVHCLCRTIEAFFPLARIYLHLTLFPGCGLFESSRRSSPTSLTRVLQRLQLHVAW